MNWHCRTRSPYWPIPAHSSFPVRIERGRTWGPVNSAFLPDLIGWLFSNTLADAVRLEISKIPNGRIIQVLGAGCPGVPYATMGSNNFTRFIDYLDEPEITVWVHRQGFFWVHNLDDEDLESMIDMFVNIQSKTLSTEA